ncbi:MAG: single-stranded-DNA-specific exonuclease RecJ [Acidobacteriaceae bacterium]|nr:single-stranded-DNA-specific exonuclease RecJ [Acidobacteriaceae bacterium]
MADLNPATGSAVQARWRRAPARWALPLQNDELVASMERDLKVHRLVAAVLCARGFSSSDEAREFLSPQLASLHDPRLMLDMERAVDRLWMAIRRGEPILLYGDYDVDGTSSIVVLKKALEILGASVDFHVPHRLNEGYGMRSDVIERAAQNGVRLIVSVDCGIRSVQVVRTANTLGMDVVVTDHHLPEATLPPALAVLNPNRPGCAYPNKHLCGAGVAFKLVQALLAASGLPESRQNALLESFLKPVAIATVADIVPLVGENRIIVQRGLSGLREVRNVGLKCLLKVAGFEDGECPSAHQVGFRIAPRINAAGRMASARDVIELFLTNDADRANELAQQLDALNSERQRVETEIVEAIVRECEANPGDTSIPAMVFAGAGWHLGVLGIVASRLVDRFSRPVFVLTEASVEAQGDEGFLSGSGRSIPAFHLLEALESMPDLFHKFGGHRQAAGLTLRAEHLETFRSRFTEFATTRLNADDLRPEYRVDAEASFPELNERCVYQVLSLGPFGFGNPAPIFLARRAEIAGPPKPITEGKHFNLPLRHNGRLLFAKAWNFGDRFDLLAPGSKVDVLFQIEDDPASRKRGYGSWCLSVKDLRPAE